MTAGNKIHGVQVFTNDAALWHDVPDEIANEFRIEANPILIEIENFAFYIKEEHWQKFNNLLSSGSKKACWLINGKPATSESIKPYLKSYSKGYIEGWNDFAGTDMPLLFFNGGSNDNETCIKIIRTAYNEFCLGDIPMAFNSETNVNEQLFYEAGYRHGNSLKAWYIIILYHQTFIKFFQPEEEIYEPNQTQKQHSESTTIAANEGKNLFQKAVLNPLPDKANTKSVFGAVTVKEEKRKELILAFGWIFGDQKNQFIELISGKEISPKLFFNGHLNQLINTLLILYSRKILWASSPQQLAKWVSKNFTYHYRGTKRKITFDAAYGEITEPKCKKPIIQIDQNNTIVQIETNLS